MSAVTGFGVDDLELGIHGFERPSLSISMQIIITLEYAKSHHKIVRAMLYAMPWPGAYEPSKYYFFILQIACRIAASRSRVPFSAIKPSARMRSEGFCSCLSVYDYSRTTGYEAANERYQQLQCYKGMKIKVGILLKRLRSRDMA